MFTESTTTEDLIASIYSLHANGFVKLAAFNALEIRCGRESAVKHWLLARNGEASLSPALVAGPGRVSDALKRIITAYLRRSVSAKEFEPGTWGRIELDGGNGDYREIVVSGYCGEQRKSFVVNTYDTGREIRICGFDEIVRRFRES